MVESFYWQKPFNVINLLIEYAYTQNVQIPRSHPRYISLKTREKLVDFLQKGILAHSGLIAHGRGEAFDYIIGERTTPQAEKAEKAAAAYILNSKNPVISVNGNTAVLAAGEIVHLSKATGAKIEVNMFHWSERRGKLIAALLKNQGAEKVLFGREKKIPGIDHARANCTRDGIYSADVVLVPLEDGDRAAALARMKKVVIAVDLNPLSRTSQAATVSIVDEVTRAIPMITHFAKNLKKSRVERDRVLSRFDNKSNLAGVMKHIKNRLDELEHFA